MIPLLRCLCLIVALALLPVHAAEQPLPVPDGSATHAAMAGMKCGAEPRCPNAGTMQTDCCSPSLPVLPAARPACTLRPVPPVMAAPAPTPDGCTWAPPERPPRS